MNFLFTFIVILVYFAIIGSMYFYFVFFIIIISCTSAGQVAADQHDGFGPKGGVIKPHTPPPCL